MITPELIKNIKKITLTTRRLMAGSIAGDYKTHVRGSGFEFNQLREYQEGDDIRFIDWQSTARTGAMMLREYRQERNRTIGILIDSSSSMQYGSGHEVKYTCAIQVAASLAYASWYTKDRVGIMLTAPDKPKILVPTGRPLGLGSFINLVNSDYQLHNNFGLDQVVEPCFARIPKNSLVIVISDFIDENYSTILRKLAQNYDLIAVRVSDVTEVNFPVVSDIVLRDSEADTGDIQFSDTHNLSTFITEWRRDFEIFCKKMSIDYTDIVVGEPFLEKIISFFNRRKTNI